MHFTTQETRIMQITGVNVFQNVCKTHRAGYLNVVYFGQGLMCTIGLMNNLIDGGQPRAKNGF